MPAGRPTKYNEVMLAKAIAYVDGGYLMAGEVIPTKQGLVLQMGVSLETIDLWAANPERPEFSEVIRNLMALQATKLLNSGLAGTFNSTITKLILTKHNYSDKIDQTVDAQVQVKAVEIKFT